ncbi:MULTISPECIES: hypothetical protein [Brucella]|uniref:Helix-turn-helix domain-containing protein n=1 Tax=Brucella pituitosa TaxID=571256 RepID=A0A643F199_9HYPH|nr:MULTISPECIES: hypothetical protein [Brucella]KAB0571251.1 hypothetical protein F7Q93_11030 [Brucella pituitosa]
MTKRHLEPARSIITKIGADDVAQVCGVHVSRAYRWMYAKEKGGTGGLIPIEHIRPIIAAAASRGIHLSADDFLPAYDAPNKMEEPV